MTERYPLQPTNTADAPPAPPQMARPDRNLVPTVFWLLSQTGTGFQAPTGYSSADAGNFCVTLHATGDAQMIADDLQTLQDALRLHGYIVFMEAYGTSAGNWACYGSKSVLEAQKIGGRLREPRLIIQPA